VADNRRELYEGLAADMVSAVAIGKAFEGATKREREDTSTYVIEAVPRPPPRERRLIDTRDPAGEWGVAPIRSTPRH
jgi:hypothetical protein